MKKLGFGKDEYSHIIPLESRATRVQPCLSDSPGSTPCFSTLPNPPFSGTHWGCSLYRVPSTPTVIFKCSSPWFSLLFSTMAAMPAPQSWAARRDTAPHTSFTTMLSSHVLSKPSSCRILLTWRRASRSLQASRAGCQDLLLGPMSSANKLPLLADNMIWYIENPGTSSQTPPFISRCPSKEGGDNDPDNG